MSKIVGVIGLVAGIFQNINTPSSWMAPQDSSKTIFRIYAGLATESGKSTSGNVPGVAAWDARGAFVGKAMGIYNYVVEEGKSWDVVIKGKKLSAEYVSVSAFGKDDLCVAAVGVTSPTGAHAGWFGDVGMKCGAPWYPSNFVIPGSDPEARPACVWITQAVSNSHPNKGMTIHLPSFTGAGLANEYNNNIDAMCKSLPRFSMWTSRSVHMTLPVFRNKLEFNEDGSDADINAILDPEKMMQSETTAPNDPTGNVLGVAKGASALETGPIVELAPSRRRRRSSKRQASSFQPLQDQLVVSNVTCHSAKEVCGSATSAGPDFVSVAEGLFCDMQEKILWPLCTGITNESCFDLDERAMRWDGDIIDDAAKSELRARGEELQGKVYRDVQSWS